MCEFMGNFCGVCVALSFGVMTYLVSQGTCHFFFVSFTSVRATKNVILWQTLFWGQCFVVVEFHQILESCQESGWYFLMSLKLSGRQRAKVGTILDEKVRGKSSAQKWNIKISLQTQ